MNVALCNQQYLSSNSQEKRSLHSSILFAQFKENHFLARQVWDGLWIVLLHPGFPKNSKEREDDLPESRSLLPMCKTLNVFELLKDALISVQNDFFCLFVYLFIQQSLIFAITFFEHFKITIQRSSHPSFIQFIKLK